METTLIELTKRLSAGDLTARAELRQHPGEMARALDQIVSELERRTARLGEAEVQFQALADQSLVGIYVTTYDRFVYLNDTALRLLGYAADELLGQRGPLDLVHPEDRALVARNLERRIAGDLDAVRYRFRVVRRDGATVHCEVHGRRVLSNGRPAVIGMALDMTEQRRARQELRELRDALLRSQGLAAIGELLGGVAHELNNTLAVILGQATLLTRTVADGPVAGRARRIADAAERAVHIVEHFLAVVRDVPRERAEVSLNQIVQDAVKVLAYQYRVADTRVVLELADDLPTIWADRHQLHQVVVNLLTNAFHAVRDTKAPRRIQVGTAYEPGAERVVMEVSDTGPGVPPAVRPRIFEPFFTTKPVGVGTGLGLSVCRDILHAHHGAINLREVPGPGATFRVELPVGGPPGQGGPYDPIGGGQAGIVSSRILVVDDEPEVLSTLAEILAHAGHRVETVADGAAALERLESRAFDLVISDVRMPGLDGPTLYEEVGRRLPGMRSRIVFLTGDTVNPETRDFLARSGAVSLRKPFPVPDVLQVIQHALARGGAADA